MPLSLLTHLPTCLFTPSAPLVAYHLSLPTQLLACLYAHLNSHTPYLSCLLTLLAMTSPTTTPARHLYCV